MDLLSAVAVSMLPLSRVRAAALFKELRLNNPTARPDELLSLAGVPQNQHAALTDSAMASAGRALESAVSAGIHAVAWFDSAYPALLNCIVDPPPVLWIRGQPSSIAKPSVAIVGSRAATPYALDVGRRLAAELAGRGVIVTSGLARGVDSAAHRGCIEAGGATVAVLGSGPDRIYPAEHARLADEIAQAGAVVSELAPGAPPLPEHFPLRNRVISGISLGVVVVEANEKSGSLITARCALEQGRDVMAVPGSVLSGRNRGSHSLLKDGATFVETADDILAQLGWSSMASGVPRAEGRRAGEEDPLLAHMDPGEACDLDSLAAVSGQPAARLLTRLMELELQGRVARSSGGRFTRLLR